MPKKNYVFKDAVALVAFQKKGLIYWSDCLQAEGKEKTEYAEQQKIMDEAASIGLKNGWIFSFQGRRSSERAIISLAGEQVIKDKRSEKILTHLSPHLCQVIKKIILNQISVMFHGKKMLISGDNCFYLGGLGTSDKHVV